MTCNVLFTTLPTRACHVLCLNRFCIRSSDVNNAWTCAAILLPAYCRLLRQVGPLCKCASEKRTSHSICTEDWISPLNASFLPLFPTSRQKTIVIVIVLATSLFAHSAHTTSQLVVIFGVVGFVTYRRYTPRSLARASHASSP